VTESGQQFSAVRVRRRDYGRALRIGLVISIVFHFLVIIVLGRVLSLDPASFQSPPRRTIELQGLPVVQVDAVLPAFETDPDAVRLPLEEELEPEVEPDGEAPVSPTTVRVPGRGLVGPPRLTNAEKLQPQEGDERLWYDLDGQPIPEYLDREAYAAYEGEIRARLSRMLDSLSLSDEQRRRALEWITGDEGHEWGVTPDGIYIAGVLIPLNLAQLFAEEGPNGRESRQQMQDLRDIRVQDMLGEAEQIQKDRAQEMRERTKQELERRLQDSLEAAVDTTGG